MSFGSKLISWYTINKRDLPWRNSKDPYFIWLSEIILQQTRVDQGLAYYLRFTEAFPTIHDLALADEEHVLKLWQGLGYYSRARNLHKTAKVVSIEMKGEFPETSRGLKSLKGVGEYTSAAIASFCYNEKVPVVDGNVARVLARMFGMDKDIAGSQGKKELQAIAQELIADVKDAATYNQAIMEFGAIHCKPAKPLCESCVFRNECFAYKHNKVQDLPVKKSASKSKHRYFNYFVVHDCENVVLQKRGEKDVWENLYEFPLAEEDGLVNSLAEGKVLYEKIFKESDNFEMQSVSPHVKHVLSHQVIHACFIRVKLKTSLKKIGGKEVIKIEKIKNFPVSRLIDRHLLDEEFFTNLS